MGSLPFALQLYTVRDHLEDDAAQTLKRVKEIGYDYVETAGFAGRSPAEFKSMLDTAGLTPVSAHVGYDDITERTSNVVATCGMLGVKYAVLSAAALKCLNGEIQGRLKVDTNTASREKAEAMGVDFNRVTNILLNLRNESGAYSYNNINDFIVDYVNWKTPLAATATCVTSTRTRGKCYTSNYAQGFGVQGAELSTTDYSFFAQYDWKFLPRDAQPQENASVGTLNSGNHAAQSSLSGSLPLSR